MSDDTRAATDAAETLKAVLHRHLRLQRKALLAKLDGVSERDARLPRTPTGTNLLGLLKHAAAVEADYFGPVFGRPHDIPMPWEAPGATEEDNLDFFAAADESRADVLEFARRCHAVTDATIAALPLDAPGRVPWWPAERADVTLGQIISHVALDEARHAGHADILREQLDGVAGLVEPDSNLPGWDAERWASYRAELTRIADRFA